MAWYDQDPEDKEFTHQNENIDLFNADGTMAQLEEILKKYEEIKSLNETMYSEQLAAAEAYTQILEDERKQAEAAHDKDIKNKKAILKVQMQIVQAQKTGNKDEEKALNKRLEIIKKTQDIEKKTADIVKQYQDDIDAREALRQAQKDAQKTGQNLLADGWKSGNFKEMKEGAMLSLTGGQTGGAGVLKALDTMTHALAGLVQKLDSTIQEIASYKSDWDTRLFGSDSTHKSITSAIQHALGASPYVKQTEVLKNIDKAVDAGIAYNVEQRAFLETISENIASTFDAFDATLLQIIRVQQDDSTAARLGMEASLNQYLNKMYKNTEYLNNLSDTVTGALYEATSLLTSQQSVGFEYQVQKWLGSLYSVGMSNQAITSIAEALGKMAAGDISGTETGAGKLLVMSASRAGINYSDMLTKGIDNSTMNELMEQMVEYLKSIANSNKVVQSQFAGIYGLRTSDIQAAANLSQSDINSISNQNLTYQGGLNELSKMARTIGTRMSTGEMMSNVIDNFKATLSTGIANSPGLYALWTMSNMLDQLTGGIPIPSIGAFAMGNGVDIDLETTVADLMRVGALGGGLLSGIGSLVSGIAGNMDGLNGAITMLGAGKSGPLRTRGQGLDFMTPQGSAGLVTTNLTTSQISYIGNASGNDVQESIMQGAEDQKAELAADAQQDVESEEDIKLAEVNDTALQILDLLQSVISGGKINSKTEFEGMSTVGFGLQ